LSVSDIALQAKFFKIAGANKGAIMLLHSTAQRLIGASVLTVFVTLLADISSMPTLAQECSDCKIPSGYTTLKQTG